MPLFTNVFYAAATSISSNSTSEGGIMTLLHTNSAFLNLVNRRHIHVLALFDTQCVTPPTINNYTHYYIARWNHRSGGIAVYIHQSLHMHIQCTQQSRCLILMSQTFSLCCVCTYIPHLTMRSEIPYLKLLGINS